MSGDQTDNPFDALKTDPALEKGGLKLEYLGGAIWFHVGRSGGANGRYKQIATAKMKPHRFEIQHETLKDETGDRIMRELYAEGVVFGWGSKAHGEGSMLHPVTLEALPFDPKNVVQFFELQPDIFSDLREQVGKSANFRKEVLKADVGNS